LKTSRDKASSCASDIRPATVVVASSSLGISDAITRTNSTGCVHAGVISAGLPKACHASDRSRGATMLYRASKHDCAGCALKVRCCPKDLVRKVPRSIHEGARDMARQIARSWEGRVSRRLRKKVEMLFAHLKRILKLDRLRLRGPNGARDEFLLAATAQNLRKLAKLIPVPSFQPA